MYGNLEIVNPEGGFRGGRGRLDIKIGRTVSQGGGLNTTLLRLYSEAK